MKTGGLRCFSSKDALPSGAFHGIIEVPGEVLPRLHIDKRIRNSSVIPYKKNVRR